jgi:hypothetical protein
MFHGEVIMCLWNYILTFLRCCCWRSHWESLCTYVWKKANLSLLLFNPISNCVWGSLFLSPPPNDGSISVVISISNKTNFLMQTIKLFILTSDYLILSCESGQENVTIYHAKDNGGECPIYMWTCMDITLSGCYYGCSREEIIAITMAFNLVKHIVPYLYNPSIFKALYVRHSLFLMLHPW